MKLKLDNAGHVVVADGKPVYVHDDGKEIPFDAPQTMATISRLNGETKGHRDRAEAAEKALKGFEGITDADAARAALATVKTLEAGKLVDAAEVEKAKAQAIKAVEDKYAPMVKKAETLEAQLAHEKIGGAFARSAYIADKLAIPPDLVQARFGDAFRIENGALVAVDGAGNRLYSRAQPGEPAGFDEALEMLVAAYPHRDSILKGRGAAGGGAKGAGGADGAGSRRLARTAFEALGSEARMAHIRGGGTVTD